MRTGRVQCIVMRDGKFLVAKHVKNGHERYVLPGGGMEADETPEAAALRELQEEACVSGQIVCKLGEYTNPFNRDYVFHNFLIDIGDQIPSLGCDPDVSATPILCGMEWKRFSDLSEFDRLLAFAGGLCSVREIIEEMDAWK